jgi:hypothetical protein
VLPSEKKRAARNKRLFQERRRRIGKRLGKPPGPKRPVPMMTATNIPYELAQRAQGLNAGGIGVVLLLARNIVMDAINESRRGSGLSSQPSSLRKQFWTPMAPSFRATLSVSKGWTSPTTVSSSQELSHSRGAT